MRGYARLPDFLTLLASVALVASTPQLCYTDVDKLAPKYIVPCWTSNTTPHYSCCKAGDKCLEHNACYDSGTGNTYQYGCTDSAYADSSVCPSKCDLNRETTNWVGLVYCNGTHGLPGDTWVCNHPDNCRDCPTHTPWDPKLEKLSETHCEDLAHDDQYVAFKEVGTISDMRQLPEETELPSYFSLNSDRWVTTAISSGASTATTGGSGTDTAAPSTTDHSHSSLPARPPATDTASSPTPVPKGHTMAIAIGLGVGVPVLLAIVGILIYVCRRRRDRSNAERQRDGSPRADPLDYPHKSGWKAELPVEDRRIYEAPDTPSQVTEMEGSTVGEQTPLQSPFVSPLLSQYSDSGDAREHRVSAIQSHRISELPG